MPESQPFSLGPLRSCTTAFIDGLKRTFRPRKSPEAQHNEDLCGILIQSYARGSVRVQKSVRYIIRGDLSNENLRGKIRRTISLLEMRPPEEVFRAGVAIVIHTIEKERVKKKRGGSRSIWTRHAANRAHGVAKRIEKVTQTPLVPKELSDVQDRVAQIERAIVQLVSDFFSGKS